LASLLFLHAGAPATTAARPCAESAYNPRKGGDDETSLVAYGCDVTLLSCF
jgi:hypothetical protein